MLRDEKKIFIEFYIKNIVCALLEPNLKNLVKGESPDFSDKKYLLEIVSLVQEDVAEPHSFFEKYKGCNISEIPDGVFKRTDCYSLLEHLSFGGYGVRNNSRELKFVFDEEKKFIAYIHKGSSVPIMAKLFNDAVTKKLERLNAVYKKKNFNYLGINFPNTALDFKEEQAIANFYNSHLCKSKMSNSNLVFFDKIFVVFYDYIFEINLVSNKTRCVKIPVSLKLKVIKQTKTNTKNYLESIASRK